VDSARELVDSTQWEWLYGELQEAVVKFEQELAIETVPLKIYRAQGAAMALRAVVNSVLKTADGLVDEKSGLTLREMEERYEREVGRS
jgi:hypothetical protein